MGARELEPFRLWNLLRCVPLMQRNERELGKMNSIVWLVGAVVIVIAILNLIGLS